MKFPQLIALTASALVLLGCNDATVAKDDTKLPPKADIDVASAKQLIAEGADLSQIPKDTWKKILPRSQYKILWEKGTEPRFTDEDMGGKQSGTYVTAACNIPVFRSEHKYDSKSGWPSFWEALDKDNIILKKDYSWGMRRIEVLSKCGEHLGHVFEDGPRPTGKRYCINSLALKFVPDGEGKQSKVEPEFKLD